MKISKEHAEKSVKHIDEQLKNAMDIIVKWSNTVKQENEGQIAAKRRQIDVDITKYKEQVQEKFDSLLRGFEDFKQRQINEFEKVDEKREKFEKMYEIGVKYSKDARFDEYSAKENKVADIFRWISLGLMVIVIIAVAYITYETMHVEMHEGKSISLIMFSTLTRFLLVFSLMIPAIYSSRESSRHRRNADKYAQMGNELRAFEIAIGTEDMKVEVKERIKEEIFKRYFGNIFADSSIDKNISDDIFRIGRFVRPDTKHIKEKDGK